MNMKDPVEATGSPSTGGKWSRRLPRKSLPLPSGLYIPPALAGLTAKIVKAKIAVWRCLRMNTHTRAHPHCSCRESGAEQVKCIACFMQLHSRMQIESQSQRGWVMGLGTEGQELSGSSWPPLGHIAAIGLQLSPHPVLAGSRENCWDLGRTEVTWCQEASGRWGEAKSHLILRVPRHPIVILPKHRGAPRGPSR
jgi:hypothetical protein